MQPDLKNAPGSQKYTIFFSTDGNFKLKRQAKRTSELKPEDWEDMPELVRVESDYNSDYEPVLDPE